MQPRSSVLFRKYFLGQVTGCSLIAINEALQIAYILEFKRPIDLDEGFLEVKRAEANEEHNATKVSFVRSVHMLRRGNLGRLILLWVTADVW